MFTPLHRMSSDGVSPNIFVEALESQLFFVNELFGNQNSIQSPLRFMAIYTGSSKITDSDVSTNLMHEP